jgi:hypothetical protein
MRPYLRKNPTQKRAGAVIKEKKIMLLFNLISTEIEQSSGENG